VAFGFWLYPMSEAIVFSLEFDGETSLPRGMAWKRDGMEIECSSGERRAFFVRRLGVGPLKGGLSVSDQGATIRRAFLRATAAVAGVVLVACTQPGFAQTPKRDVSLRLDWLFQGPNAGFMVAKAKGYYADVGLNVDIGPGRGSGSTAQLIASKAAMFGFSDGYVVGNSVAKDMSITMVAAFYRRNPAAAIVLKDSDITAMKDLEGKSIGISTGSAQFQQWPAVVKGCKLDGDKITVVNVDPAGSIPALVTGKVQAIAGFAQGQVPGVEIRAHKEARTFMYADCGVDAVSNGIIVHRDMLKEDPELIRSFVKASIKGFLYSREHPDEAVAITKTFSEAIVPEIARRELEMSFDNWVTPNTAGKPLGWMSDKDWESTVRVLKQYGGVTTPLEASVLFTNEFVPTEAEFVPPQPK
jgi:NitT/TauT family transport system substrate-binding protein